MCGIAGVYCRESRPVPRPLVAAMTDSLRHRGPDEEGIFVDGSFGFGMRRLSIIDLKTGQQPISNEDGSVRVVLNGEIYNYQELGAHLRARGHVLQTTSDTEVIVHLYEDYGAELVHHLRGMFAFAVWDARRRSVLIARDRLGIKPLYYAFTGSGLIFASELKAMVATPDITRDIDHDAMAAYLRFGYVPDPASIFRGVRKLPPGHMLTFEGAGEPEVRGYWDPLESFARRREARSLGDVTEELRHHLRDAVRSHLVSDVPVGVFLSGGIDSSAVAALMARESNQAITAFSIGFREAEYDERRYARIAAEHCGMQHRELVVEPQSADTVAAIFRQFDEPFADASAVPTYFVSQLAAQDIKVVLSGDGGDEVFAGYDRYVTDYRRAGLGLAARPLAPALRSLSALLSEGTPGKNFLFNMSLPRTERYLDDISRFAPRRLQRLLDGQGASRGSNNGFAPHVSRGRSLPFPARLQYLDMKTYLPGDILTKVDRMSMAHSIEVRVPLLDHVLVEFAAGLPSRYHLERGETKALFKRAVADLLPATIRNRPKQGFAVPLERWFRGDWHELLGDVVLSPSAMTHGFFRRSYVEALYSLYRRTRRGDALDALWTLLVFEMWYRSLGSEKVTHR